MSAVTIKGSTYQIISITPPVGFVWFPWYLYKKYCILVICVVHNLIILQYSKPIFINTWSSGLTCNFEWIYSSNMYTYNLKLLRIHWSIKWFQTATSSTVSDVNEMLYKWYALPYRFCLWCLRPDQ